MKILDAEAIRAIDSYTIAHEPVSSADLMERAARACFVWIRRRFREKRNAMIFCGMGNNGGDGLALARMLAGSGIHTQVIKLAHTSGASTDYLHNEKRLHGVKNLSQTTLNPSDSFPAISPDYLVIDAIFGSGLNRNPEGFLAEVIQHINHSGALVVSIDMPSGLFCNGNGLHGTSNIIKADYTLAFQFPRLAFMFSEYEVFTGEWHILDIGLHPEAIKLAETQWLMPDSEDIRSLYKPRGKFTHKGHYGHSLLFAGSRGKAGAAILAARAALRSGLGLLTVYTPDNCIDILQQGSPEAMCLPSTLHQAPNLLPDPAIYAAVGAGPGIGTDDTAAKNLQNLIRLSGTRMVLDADALNILAENPTWLDHIPSGSVITPHPKEFDRLGGKSASEQERLGRAIDFSRRHNLIVVLKTARTAIITPQGKVFFNSSGNPGMATAGSGDVLTGAILGWMSQGYGSLESCLIAVFLHGFAGDIASGKKGHEGMIASDIVELLPIAARKTFKK